MATWHPEKIKSTHNTYYHAGSKAGGSLQRISDGPQGKDETVITKVSETRWSTTKSFSGWAIKRYTWNCWNWRTQPWKHLLKYLTHETFASQLEAFRQNASVSKEETDPLHIVKTTKHKQHAATTSSECAGTVKMCMFSTKKSVSTK